MATSDPEQIDLSTAANGHALISTFSPRQRRRLGLLLILRYGFLRWGRLVPPIADAAVYPDLIRWGMRIHSGWDNWIGYDLLASNQKTDEFLRGFFTRHCQSKAAARGA
jgi:hypothetical protein